MTKETIQEFIEHGDTLEVWCHSCRHHARIDMLKLRDRLGPDHSAMHDDIIRFFRCSKCGEKRRLGLLRTSKGNDKRVPHNSAYAKAKGL